MKKVLFLISTAIFGCLLSAHAQSGRIYTNIEAGGMLGINKPEGLPNNDALKGYKFHLMVGRNVNDHFYLGFGLGNEVYTAPHSNGPFGTRFSLLPLLADFRLPLTSDFASGSLKFVANGGYAPRLGNDTFKGALALGGLNYGYPLSSGVDLSFTLGYAYQQIVLRNLANNLQQHSISLTVGLFIN